MHKSSRIILVTSGDMHRLTFTFFRYDLDLWTSDFRITAPVTDAIDKQTFWKKSLYRPAL